MSPSIPSTSAARGRTALTLPPARPWRCADNVITFRSVVKMMAVRNGLWAAFSPKPIPDQAGQRLPHCHAAHPTGRKAAPTPFWPGCWSASRRCRCSSIPGRNPTSGWAPLGRRPLSPGRIRAGAPCCAAKPTAAWSSPPPTAPPIPTWPSPC